MNPDEAREPPSPPIATIETACEHGCQRYAEVKEGALRHNPFINIPIFIVRGSELSGTL